MYILFIMLLFMPICQHSSTESYDDFGPIGEDPRWETFEHFHDYLLEAFPLVSVISRM